jgi:hypothetical protein
VSENIELVRAWHEAAFKGRVEDMLALTHPEFEMNEASALPGAAHVKGREGLLSYARGWARNWSEWEWLEHEIIELPRDRVLFDATLRLRGLRSSIWVEHRWVYLLEIRDGLVARDDGFLTRDELFRSLDRAAAEEP